MIYDLTQACLSPLFVITRQPQLDRMASITRERWASTAAAPAARVARASRPRALEEARAVAGKSAHLNMDVVTLAASTCTLCGATEATASRQGMCTPLAPLAVTRGKSDLGSSDRV